MEPVTHFLTGACIGRAGFNRRTAYATLAATLAAEAPDMDIFWSTFGGPVTGLEHHRGITHTFIAAPFAALIITGLVWVIDWLYTRLFSRSRRAANAPPIRWLWIWFAALVAHFSHILLDWTNNYGVRPFFPFNRHWYSGDLVFIAEPVIWGLLLLALILPSLLGLADREVGDRRTRLRGRGWAIFALLGMTVLWCWRWAEHANARNLVEASQVTPTPVLRVALEPYPANPWRWHALLETADTWQTAEVDTRTGQVVSDPRLNAVFKPEQTPAIAFARKTELGRVYQDWSTWPVIRDRGQIAMPGNTMPEMPAGRPWTAVQFSDLRFAYAYLDTSMVGSPERSLEHMLASSGLAGWVYVLDGKEDAGQFLNGKEQK